MSRRTSQSVAAQGTVPIDREVRGRLLLPGVIALLCLGGLLCFDVAGSEADEGIAGCASEPSVSLAFPFGAGHAAPPHAVAIEASRLKFARLGSRAAVEVAECAFYVEAPAVPMPGSEPGSSLGSYLGSDAVDERLPGGQRVLTASTFPLRVDTPSGLQPTSFRLRNTGGAFVPANPVVPVSIGTSASDGVAFENGISVTPVGAAQAEAPVLAGDQVVFPNVGTDTDLMAGARPYGAEISWLLRSEHSPSDESLRSISSGLTLQQLASACGVSSVELAGVERGLEPGLLLFTRLLAAFDVSAAELLDGIPVPGCRSDSGASDVFEWQSGSLAGRGERA
jgi:hypothetical protein